jgi:hypothetical protein
LISFTTIPWAKMSAFAVGQVAVTLATIAAVVASVPVARVGPTVVGVEF